MPVDPSGLLAARSQMAFTLGYHIVLACLGVGLPVLMLFAEWRHMKTGDPLWRTLARRWSKAFAVLFAVGAVSGTVLSFELGLLWPAFMAKFGPVIGLPFTLEAFAFFLEAIFAGIYLYGWDRLPARTHWLTGFPVAICGAASAWFVVTANSWMNSPTGFTMQDGRVVDADPIAAMMNPATWSQTTHMILAAYIVTGFSVAAVYALARLKGKETLYHRRAMSLGLAMGIIVAPLQIVAGDFSARMVAATQPAKLAAMEGHMKTGAGAPIRLPGGIEIPKGLSLLAYHDPNAVVKGLDDFPPEDRPPHRIVHAAFQVMVGAGMALVGIAIWAGFVAWRRKKFPEGKFFLRCLVVAGPLSILALEAGWVVTEVGRQPWIVNGLMRTRDAVTQAPGIGFSLALAIAIYAVLSLGLFLVLRILSRLPVEGDRA